MKTNYKILVKLRMLLFNRDCRESDVVRGVRINQSHLIKVLEAKRNKGLI